MSISLIYHKGKKVLFVDYSRCRSEEEMISTLHKAGMYIHQSIEKTLAYSDFSNTNWGIKFLNAAQRLKSEILDSKEEKGAMVGITNVQELLLKGYNIIAENKTMNFESKEKALDFLIKKSEEYA